MRRDSRAAMTIIELAVVLGLLGFVGGIIGLTLTRQQRFYRGARELLHAREGVRDAAEVLAADLRGMSPADTPRLLADSAVEFFAAIGSSVVCESTAPDLLALAAAGDPRGNTLTAFLTQPDTGDLALVYYASDSGGVESWHRHRIASLGPTSVDRSCDLAPGPAVQQAPWRVGFNLRLAAPAAGAPYSFRGAPVRFIRRGRYSIYRSSDGAWYLGYRRCNAVGPSACGGIQPLSGPYRPYDADGAGTGLLLEYFDGSGYPLGAASPLGLARIDVTVRAESQQRILIEGARTTRYGDSAKISVAVRNRLP